MVRMSVWPKRLVKFLISWVGICCLLPAASMAAAFSVTVDHTTIGRNHTFQLAARLEGSSDDFTLDIMPLNKDFYVTIQSDTQRAGLWREKHYRLGAKRTGTLRVPQLTVMFHGRKLASQVFSVNVLDTGREVDDVRLWVEDKVSRKQSWLHQQLVWQMVVFSTYPLADTPAVQLPSFDGFDVRKADAAVPGERVMNGRRLFSMSWHVLLFPRRTGDLRIERPVVSARLLQTVKTHRFAAGNPNFDAGETIIHAQKALGSKQHIRVRALPSAAVHLPVGHLTLTADISDAHAYVASPLTWNIHLTGKQMRRSDMPDLQKRLLLDGPFTVVREKPLVSEHKDGHGISVEVLYRMVLSPSRQGELRLPGMDMPFFNPDNGRVEHASFAPRQLMVLPRSKTSQNEGFEIGRVRTLQGVHIPTDQGAPVHWKAWAIVMFSLWLFTLVAWAFSSRARLAAGHIFSRKRRRRAAPSLRHAMAASDAGEQFSAMKDALGLSTNITPLGLMTCVPDLRDGEAGAWLDALERARWQGGDKPQPLDSACVRHMVQIICESKSEENDIASQAFNPADFGRIGG